MISLKFLSLLGLFLSCATQVESEDILGCGGFVKSEVDINFSMVEVSALSRRADSTANAENFWNFR